MAYQADKLGHLAPFVITLKGLKPKQRRLLLEGCPAHQITAMSEVCLNLVKNTPGLLDEQLAICRRWHRPLRLLVSKRYPRRQERIILQ